ncbi:MAG: hypothetical protein WDW36_001429 [Sanguina aurantia]
MSLRTSSRFGLATFVLLTLACRRVFHDPLAERLLATQVPEELHDRSTFIFMTAMSLDLLNVFFERNTVKLDFVLLPAFIKFVACTTNMMIQFGSPVLCVSAGGRLVIFQRYICWMHTTATMLLLLKLMSKTITLRELGTAIAFDEVMMTTGALACLTSGCLRVLLAFISHASLVPILFYMHKAFMGARIDTKSSVRVTLLITYTFTVALWISFGVVWDMAVLDLISPLAEETLYLTLDFCAKVLFSSTLMLGSFKGLEQQRLDTMRLIELRSKHSMIEELRGLLARKERFMNSMSHELRTPLNGIIGISEGMLSGCCGVLHERVTHQIHIICTSGARLLSLIHDVMDAAVLHHKSLVLKQDPVGAGPSPSLTCCAPHIVGPSKAAVLSSHLPPKDAERRAKCCAINVSTAFVSLANAQHATALRKGEVVSGPLAASQSIPVVISLKLRNQDQLDSFLANAQKPGTPVAQRTMTPEQFAAQYSPTQAQAQAVASYLTSAGFKNVTIAPNRLLVTADSTADTVRAAFHTTFEGVRTPDGRNAFHNTSDVMIPSALQDSVLSVVGLDTVHVSHTFARFATTNAVSTQATGTAAGHNPVDFATIYGANTLATASTIPVGIIVEGSMTKVLSDLKTFASNNGLAAVTTQVVGSGGSDTSGDGEWDLDSQDIVGISGGVQKIIFYDTTSLTDANLTADYNAAVTANAVKVINVSLGECETSAKSAGTTSAEDQIFKQAVAQGQTFSVSSGDSGADECGTGGVTPSWPASSQYVVAVGGTELYTSGTTWGSETVWNNLSASEGATGGSPSTFEPQPTWQSGVGQNAGHTTRGVPDIAFDASPVSGALVIVDGAANQQIGGTSLASPLFVGAWARTMAAKGSALGFAAPLIYKLPTSAFHDVTSGNNSGETAAAGWDYTTGFGSLIVSQVVANVGSTGGGGTGGTPTANFSYSASNLAVTFTDSSTDSGGTISTHAWTFGDGSTSSTTSPSHTYAAAGTYSVTETVTDSASGATSAKTSSVTVTAAGGGGSSQLIVNGGFETGAATPWTLSSGTLCSNSTCSGEVAHAVGDDPAASSTRLDASQGFSSFSDSQGASGLVSFRRSSLPLPRKQPGGGPLDSAQAGPPRRQAHSVKHGRYLLLSVDDDPVNQSVVRSLLSSTGYEIVTVPGGPAALAYLEACDSLPDVILLDCMMPGMDGYEVLARVRAMFTHTYIPVIMVSAQAEEGHVVQGLDQGADDYVTKPFNRLEFLARIKAQLGFEGDDEDESRGQGGGCESRLNQERLILCVDDDGINQMILAGMLRSQLYRCVKAKTGSEGLAFITPTSAPPDLVLLDCSLPDMTGFDVCVAIRKMYSKLQVPIIMLSARHNEAAIVEGLQCGANDYVTKPFRRGELLARIRMALRSRNGAATDDARDNVGENGPVRRLSRAASLDLISTAKAEDGKASACTLPALRHLSRTYDSSHDDFSDLFNLNTLSTTASLPPTRPSPPPSSPARPAAAGRPPSPAPPSPTWHDVGVVVAQIVEPVTGGPGGALSASEGASVRDRFAEMFRMVEAQHGLSHLAGGEGVLSSGASLLALHRAALALLDGASWLALPRARTGSLMVRVAIHAGPVSGPPNATGHASPVAVANPRETLELLLSGATALLQWAPPMTAVCGDLAALHLREMGLGNVRELPLALLQAGAQQPDRRVWLVEAHALSNLAPPTLPGMRASQPSQPSRRPPGSSNLYTAEWAHHPAPDASSSWVGSNTNLFASLQGQAQRPAQHSGGQASPSGHSPRLTSGWRQQQQQQQCAAVGQSAESATTSRGSREEIDELKRKVNSLKMQLEVAHARAVLSSAGSTTPGGIHNDADDNAAREPAKRTLSRPSALQERKDKTQQQRLSWRHPTNGFAEKAREVGWQDTLPACAAAALSSGSQQQLSAAALSSSCQQQLWQF